ncbi:MAG: ABC transporter ATP-binding protein [Vallitalea sp.]|jgi:NitT/TauT family transport system ATP-binding protein|nr:ABC transporter ATP-binding protein [Vallitalea sp.]
MIQINNLYKSYDNLKIFEDFNLKIDNGQIICLLGPSGCGKTTLLNILSGIENYDKGNITGISDSFSYIFQETRLLPWLTIEDNIKFVLKSNNNLEITDIVNRYLDVVQLSEYKNYYPSQLSGGMKQRVSIARAFAYESDILLMDEPFKGLDYELKKKLINAFLSLWKYDNRTVLFVTHDIDEAILISDIIYILDGRPVKVKNRLKIDIPREERNTEDKEFIELKNIILS